MPQPSEIEALIQQAVTEVLDSALPNLRQEIVRRAMAAVQASAPAPGSSPTELLSAAATAIQESSSQADILRRLLEGGSRFAPRIALFVIKTGSISGWQGLGFDNEEAIRNASLNGDQRLVAEAVQGRVPAFGSTAEFDQALMDAVKAPAEDQCLLLPFVVKEKTAALIYADGGTKAGEKFDASALSVLTRFAALWLESTSSRKFTQEESAQAPAAAATMAAAVATSVPAPAASEDGDLQKKARRFAKLLVEEIMLYNQAKVTQGRENRDLYSRLREDIEKSRATYNKRYSETPAASGDYFNQELIRILADNNISLLGDGFPRS